MFGNRFTCALKKYGKDNMGIQNIFTPLKNIEAITNIQFKDFITPEMKNIGVLFNWEFIANCLEDNLEHNYLNKDVKFTYFYDSTVDARILKTLVPTIHCIDFYKYRKKFSFAIEFVDITKFTEQNKDVKVIETAMTGKHFDIVFSNPPYNKNIDLQILQTVLGHTDKAVFIHPAGYLLDKKFKTKIYNDVRNTNYLEKAVFIWGNEMFNIGLFMPLTISVWNINKTSDECIVNDMAISHTNYTCKINDISIHPAWITAWKNSLNITKTLESEVTPHGQLSDYSVRFGLIQGTSKISNYYTDDFFNFTGKNVEKNKCDRTFEFSKASREHGCIQAHWAFENENIRENFLEYCKTKVVRFLLSFVKNGPNVGRGELAAIPWMDFSQEWNDAKLCKEFRIDKELWNYIDKFIPDFYEDYKSGF